MRPSSGAASLDCPDADKFAEVHLYFHVAGSGKIRDFDLDCPAIKDGCGRFLGEPASPFEKKTIIGDYADPFPFLFLLNPETRSGTFPIAAYTAKRLNDYATRENHFLI